MVLSCDDPSGPVLPPRLEFEAAALELGPAGDGHITIRNTGGRAVGPVTIVASGVTDPAGSTLPGAHLVASPSEIATLNPGDQRLIEVELSSATSLMPGRYGSIVTALAGAESARLDVGFTVANAVDDAVTTLQVHPATAQLRTGDVVGLGAEARDAEGALVHGAQIVWTVEPGSAGFVSQDGRFVGYEAGPVTISARVGAAVGAVALEVGPRGTEGSFTVIGRAAEHLRFTSDLWLHGAVAYSGTLGARPTPGGVHLGNTLNVWHAGDPSAPVLAFTIEVDARTVNDVKVRSDGALAIITHEGSDDARNGITILDLEDPLRPRVVGRFTEELESGVHNVWVEGSYVYLVVDGFGNGLRILDISNPAAPTIVARYYAGSSFLHDVYVRDGLAFLSHWNAGLVILDVGHGIAGGSPESPVEVSRLSNLGGETHNAWYWPEAGYVFVGEEDFITPGITHVVDVRDLRDPREVATYRVAGQPPHNFWLDEVSGTLYLAWYAHGVRALDVTGELLGELDRQGRETGAAVYNGGAGYCGNDASTCTWAPQLHEGVVWVSDTKQGLVALNPPG